MTYRYVIYVIFNLFIYTVYVFVWSGIWWLCDVLDISNDAATLREQSFVPPAAVIAVVLTLIQWLLQTLASHN